MNEIQFNIMNSNVAYKISLIYFIHYFTAEEQVMPICEGLKINNSAKEHSSDQY